MKILNSVDDMIVFRQYVYDIKTHTIHIKGLIGICYDISSAKITDVKIDTRYLIPYGKLRNLLDSYLYLCETVSNRILVTLMCDL